MGVTVPFPHESPILECEQANTTLMTDMVDEDEKVRNNVCTLGGKQKAWFLTEDGLY